MSKLLVDDEKVTFYCPGCGCTHDIYYVGTGHPVWQWYGDVDTPTITPSILVQHTRFLTDEEHKRVMAGEQVDIPTIICHSFITDGKVQYLPDCTHSMAGQTIEMVEWEQCEKCCGDGEYMANYGGVHPVVETCTECHGNGGRWKYETVKRCLLDGSRN